METIKHTQTQPWGPTKHTLPNHGVQANIPKHSHGVQPNIPKPNNGVQPNIPKPNNWCNQTYPNPTMVSNQTYPNPNPGKETDYSPQTLIISPINLDNLLRYIKLWLFDLTEFKVSNINNSPLLLYHISLDRTKIRKNRF